MRNKLAILILFVLGICTNIFSNDNPPDDCFLRKNERVYVHLQKQVLISGEDLIYKAYVVNLASLKPTSQSRVVYFAIRDTNNRLVMSWRANLNNGICSGSVALPDTVSTGFYTLYAFTNWMRNLSPAYFYSSRLLITKVSDNNPEKSGFLISRSHNESLVSFFPEGGNFVEGLTNHIGFRLNKPEELPNIISVSIVDDQRNLVDSLSLTTIGTGGFILKPDSGKRYVAQVATRDRGIVEIPLPNPVNQGYTMHVENLPAIVKVQVNSNMRSLNENEMVGVMAWMKGKMVFTGTVPLHNGSGSLQINKSALSEGVVLLNIVDSKNNLVAERLIYVEKSNKPSIKVTSSKSEYSKKGKIKLEIETSNFSGSDTLDFSISVTSATPFQPYLDKSNIDKYLYLFSEIQNNPYPGQIPWTEVKQDDLLLVTDVKKYAWNINMQRDVPYCKYFTENRGFVLSGNVTSLYSSSPDSSEIVLLSCADSIPGIDYSYMDKAGNFQFLLDKQYDNKKLILQLIKQNDIYQNASWKLDDKYDKLLPGSFFPVYFTKVENEYLDLSRKIFLIENIYNQNQKASAPALSEKTLSFYGEPNYTIYPEDYTQLNDFNDLSKNILPGVKFRNRKDTTYLNVLNLKREEFFKNGATVLLNGVPFYDLSFISTLSSKDIKRVDVKESEIIYGDLTFYGLVAIRTNDGLIPASYFKKNAYLFTNTVYTNNDYYEHPSDNSTEANVLPDLKQNLCWKPDITIIGNNKITLEFSASNLQSEYEVNIQGISSSGVPVSSVTHFTVK